MATIAGTCYLSLDGKQVQFDGEITYNSQTEKKAGVLSNLGVAGIMRTAVIPEIKLTAIRTPDLNVDELLGKDNITLTLEEANGNVTTFIGAFITDVVTQNPTTGKIPLKLQAVSVKKVVR